MEMGEMRVEANVSISKDGTLGTKVEIKNLNSFNAMERAVSYEIKRQEKLLEKGGAVEQQTLGWDENKQATFPQRTKEGSADYRYFPDPDLPSLKLSELPEFGTEVLKKSLPELPAERRVRYKAMAMGIKSDDADLYVRDASLGTFFEEVISDFGSDASLVSLASNYIANDLVSLIRDADNRETEMSSEMPISASNFRTIINMVAARKISSRAAKDILLESVSTHKDPEVIAKERDLFQKSSEGDLEGVVADVIAKNSTVVADFKAGKGPALEYLVGQCMKVLKGSGDPVAIRKLLVSKIG